MGLREAKTLFANSNTTKKLRESVDADEFSKRVVNLEDGFDPLPPSTHPHVDQSARGATLRVWRHMGDRADEVLKGRVRIIK